MDDDLDSEIEQLKRQFQEKLDAERDATLKFKASILSYLYSSGCYCHTDGIALLLPIKGIVLPSSYSLSLSPPLSLLVTGREWNHAEEIRVALKRDR